CTSFESSWACWRSGLTMCRYPLRPIQRSRSVFMLAIRGSKSWQPLALEPWLGVAPWQSGVYWANDAQADLFEFTLDKTSGSFSPTTRYKDYAVSRDLIHWESQSVNR